MSETALRDRADDSEEITRDECFDLLKNPRRRRVLRHLSEEEATAQLGQLSEQVAAWENETAVEELSYNERKRVYTSLQQVHLPRMDDAGVVTFDDREGTVELGPAAENLDVYLDIVDEGDIPWSQLYLLLALVHLGLLGVGSVGSFSVSGTTMAVFILTTFLVTASVHVYQNRSQLESDAVGC